MKVATASIPLELITSLHRPSMLSFHLFRAATRSWPVLYIFWPSPICSAFCISKARTTVPVLTSSTSTKHPERTTSPFIPTIQPEAAFQTRQIFSHHSSLLPTRHFSSSTHDDFIIGNTNGGRSSNSVQTSTSTDFAMNPYSDEARSTTQSLGISTEQHDKLTQLSHLVVEWNERLNLISRRDCNLEVVFGRHVLPSVALAALPDFQRLHENEAAHSRIVDVGTGGGFPGLPLSIVFPEAQFLLVDSVGKKLKAVAEMATELELNNISTHHGRAEQIADDPIIGRRHKNKYDICVGRSVTAMPRFCFWIRDLLKKKGKLIYIIGGEVEDNVQSRVESEVPIDELLGCEGASDKKTLILKCSDVISIARESGEKKVKVSNRRNKVGNKNKTRQDDEGKWNNSKGNWKSRDNAAKKERGYSNFKRYEVD